MVDEMFDGEHVALMEIEDAQSSSVGGGSHMNMGSGGSGSGANGGGGGLNGGPMQQANALMQDLTANDRCVHADFQNKFGKDLFDDKDLQ